MNKCKESFWNQTRKGCLCVLGIVSLFITVFLAYFSTISSFYSPTDGSASDVIADSVAKNLLYLFGAVLLTVLLEYFLQKYPSRGERFSYAFLALCCVLFFIAGCVWTTQLPYYPTGDQLNTTAAAEYARQGNFSMFQKGGYIGIYAQQKGLVFLYEILFSLFGSYCYNVVEKFHVLSGAVVMIFGFLFLKDYSDKCIYRYIYCVCILFCAPYMILMPYIYGDIPSICFGVILFWASQRYGKTSQRRYVVVASLMAILALFNRQNSWIVLIALGIGFLLLAMEKHNIRPLLAGACILLSSALSVELLDLSYEIRSGYEDTNGTPASLYFAMGMQEGLTGLGTYNRFNQGTYESVDFDREAASQLGWLEVEDRIDFFQTYPRQASYFFRTKIRQQWTEPLFETLSSTTSFPEDSTLPDWIFEIYYGKYHDPLFCFANYYQTIVYIALLVYVLSILQHNSHSMSYVPLIAMVGGFLFSIIWEAQCRYVLPYYIFILLYVPVGLYQLSHGLIELVRRILHLS